MGIYNLGGVCTVELDYKVEGYKTVADAEVPVLDSKKATFDPIRLPVTARNFSFFRDATSFIINWITNKSIRSLIQWIQMTEARKFALAPTRH